VPGRGWGDVGGLRNRFASELDWQRAGRNLLGGFESSRQRGLSVRSAAGDAIFRLAKERGNLAAGPGPAGTCGLTKQIVAVGGDRVAIDREGVWVNGILLKNSAPRLTDEAGQLMPACYLSDYTLRVDEVLLMSDHDPASFDGRYFGPLPKTTIQSVIMPVITWK